MFWKLTSKCMCRILGILHLMRVLMNVMQLSANSHVMYGILSIALTHTIAFFLLYFPTLYSIFNWNFMHAKEQDMRALISICKTWFSTLSKSLSQSLNVMHAIQSSTYTPNLWLFLHFQWEPYARNMYEMQTRSQRSRGKEWHPIKQFLAMYVQACNA
jgi:hypothetical protein